MFARNYSVLFAVGATIVLGIGMLYFWPQAPLNSAPTAENKSPARLVCFGYVDHREVPLLLQPTRSGRVEKVFVKENQTVAKDALLVQLDDHLVMLQERQAQLGVDAAKLQLAKAENGVKQYEAKRAQASAALEAANNKVAAAQYALTRKQELVEKELVNRVEEDVARAQLNEASALVKAEQNRLVELGAVNPEVDVKLAKLQLEQSQARLEEARRDRAEYLLRAPIDGEVLRVQVQSGDLAGPASPRPAVWLAPTGPHVVRAEVSQEFAGLVETGAMAEVEDEAAPGILAAGVVSEVSDWFLPRRQFIDLPTGVNTGLTMECVIELKEGHKPLRVGQRVRVRILEKQPVENGDKRGAPPARR